MTRGAGEPRRGRRLVRLWPAGVAVLATVALAVAAIVVLTRGSGGTAHPYAASVEAAVANPNVDPGSQVGGAPAPAFTLRDQHGRLVSLRQFRGKIVVLAFVDARCTTVCPLTTASMLDAVRLLGPVSARVQLLGIDANPLATRVSDVAAYTRAHGLAGRWLFLTGSRARLARVWRAYHVYAAARHGVIDHQPVVLLIDAQGRERTVYLTQMRYEGVVQQAQLLADGIARLIPGRPAVRHTVSLGYVRPLGPKARVSLPALGRTRHAVLGPSHPHLLVFFATWLHETSNLSARLAALDRYRVTARARGWPSPVAVDEISTESSPGAVRGPLARLAGMLHFPLVEDAGGRLADGYGVGDQPWLVLTSRSGRILWHHDGWLALAALERQVRAALARG